MKRILSFCSFLLFPLAIFAGYEDHGRDYSVEDGISGTAWFVIVVLCFIVFSIYAYNKKP